ncbi:hypothetical protein AYO44_15560 [Planctomycetaceae bacterium SCGC AG-212-F19]|nr:hypothetical protein AYO44_15560 [Planctomycetaceae bacterium SCGC AG-212-F19]
MRGTMLVLMTSAGHLLEGSIKDKNGLAQGLQEVLEAYAKLPEAQRRAQAVDSQVKPQVAPPPGGLVLTIHDRILWRDQESRYRHAQGSDLDDRHADWLAGQRTSLWLSEEECKSLIPQSPQKGQTQPVPSKLAKRIWLFGLLPYTPSFELASWLPNSVREGELKLTVEDVSPQAVRMRIHGTVVLVGPPSPDLLNTPGLGLKDRKDLENRYDARLEGTLVYDRAAARISAWDMAALGDYVGMLRRIRWHDADNPLRLGFAFKLDQSDYELPPERRRPRSMVHAYRFKDKEQYYWDPEKWEEEWKKQQKR